jgi:hypothetical protein
MPQLLHYLNVDKGTSLVRLQPLKKPVQSAEKVGSAVTVKDTNEERQSEQGNEKEAVDDDIHFMKAFVNDKHVVSSSILQQGIF